MEYAICASFDSAAHMFQRPFFTQTKGVAIRAFMDEVNRSDKDNIMYSHPGDFSLFYLGNFDDSDGSFKLIGAPERIASGLDVKAVPD